MTEAGVAVADPLALPLAEARAIQDRYFAFLAADPPPVARIEDAEVDGPAGSVPLRLFYPAGSGPFPVVLFLRGAGWWAGGIESHARTARLIALESAFAVCAVGYHSSPEYKCPVQVEEALAAVRWLRSKESGLDVRADRLALWGESAGASMSLGVAQMLRDAGDDLPAGLVLFYGNFAGPSPQSRAYSKWVWQQYLRDASQAADPRAVPLVGEMRGLPPMWLAVGDDDPLMKDTLALAEKLRDAGVPHEVKIYPGLPHAFVMFNRIFTGAVLAIREAGRAAQSFMHATVQEKPVEVR